MSDEAELLKSAAALRAGLSKLNRRLRSHEEAPGVGTTALSLLSGLYWSGPCSASDLAARVGLQPQSLTRTLHRLEERGLIDRAIDDDDRRRSTIRITESGMRLLQRHVRTREAWLADAMARKLSPAECQILNLAAELLERLADE
jgi:DNA-binding MarR family transcriptional regulator